MSVYNLQITQGATFQATIRMVDEANNNLLATATEAKAQIRDSTQANSNVIAELDCGFTEDNAIVLGLPESETINLTNKPMFWDLRVTWPDKVDYPLSGKVKLTTTVTR